MTILLLINIMVNVVIFVLTTVSIMIRGIKLSKKQNIIIDIWWYLILSNIAYLMVNVFLGV